MKFDQGLRRRLPPAPIQASVQESSQRRGGPGNAICMTAENLYEAAVHAEL